MSGKTLSRHMVICDGGCGATVGENGEYATASESRAAAAERGWKVLPKLRTNGKPAQAMDEDGRLLRGHDVCPECLPEFKPDTIKPVGGSGYIRQLQEENRRLREELRR